MQEFGYYILFGARANKGNQCETTKDDFTDFTEHNISNAIKVSLNHVISWHRENWQRLPRALEPLCGYDYMQQTLLPDIKQGGQ